MPDRTHLGRVPDHITAEQLQRVRKAAFNLPQVVTPGDFAHVEGGQGKHAGLDARGYIRLQNEVAGVRASRWIAPALIDEALAHLDAMATPALVRDAMQRGTATLERLNIERRGDAWEMVAEQVLTLSGSAWHIKVAYGVALPAALIWALYRANQVQPLKEFLAQRPGYSKAAELTAHLEGLVAKAQATHPGHVELLMPALQAECAKPRELERLRKVCDIAFKRWQQRAQERSQLDDLTQELAFQGYPDTFSLARRLGRKVTLFVGPPNSGKTHQAFERLARADSGAYLAPLRLLALEGRDRLAQRDVPCSLLTGEERDPVDDARVVSSTIEMLDTGTVVDVAVIDEAQMLFDASRGWAWTQAIVGVPAREVLIICSAYAVKAIEALLGVCGESCTVRTFERKQHVQVLPRPVPLRDLRKADAVVAFSRRDVLMLRDQIAQSGKRVSVIYGALPPEVRRREAERFAKEESDVLVATDAIGMGLNLPIRRVLFSTAQKYDGRQDRPLDESEVHQIAGRAGRFGLHEEGFAGVLSEAEPLAAQHISQMLAKTPRAPRHFKAPVAPNWWHVETISQRMDQQRLSDVLAVFMEHLRLDSEHFAVAELEQMVELATALDSAAPRLGLRERFAYAQAPVDMRTPAQLEYLLGWVARHTRHGAVGQPDFIYDADGSSRLDRMEQALKVCNLWLWLDLRFEGVYGSVKQVTALRGELNDGIERQLKGKKPLWETRRR